MVDDDPGWRRAWVVGALGFIPAVGLMRARRNRGPDDALVTLRGLTINFAVAAGMVGVVVVILDRYAGLVASADTAPLAGTLVVFGVSLLGFTAMIVTAEPWLYAIGLVFTATGFCRTAPTRTNLVRDQERLRDQGVSLDLVQAIRTPQS